MRYIPLLLLSILMPSCSSYVVDDSENNNISLQIKLDCKDTGSENSVPYPVAVFCISKEDGTSRSNMFYNGEPLTVHLPEGEHSVNVFCGFNNEEYISTNDFEQQPVITMSNNCTASSPLMAAHTVMEIKKASEVSMMPSYIVASVELVIENVPTGVNGIEFTVSPVCGAYGVEGYTYETNNTAIITCQGNDGKWTSGIRYLFPSGATNTKLCISMDYGNETKNYSYTLKKGLERGKPYRFTGKFEEGSGGNGSGDLELNGSFLISGWEMEEEIELDLEDETTAPDNNDNEGNEEENGDIERFVVDEIPEAYDIFGPMFVWKSEETSPSEAVVTVIGNKQWTNVLAGEALAILGEYSVDGIKGWRMFTEAEARKFHHDFTAGEVNINDILEDNGHHLFYYEGKERYLCDNARKTFKLYGASDVRKAGKKTEYYLRPVKTMRLVLKK